MAFSTFSSISCFVGAAMRPPLEPNKKARSGWCTRTSFLLLLGAKTVISRLAKMFYFNNM